LITLLITMPTAFGKASAPGISQEILCLAKNVYHESRGEPFKGRLAVAVVTINRTKSGKYPSSICGVVYQKNQFSWTNMRVKITDWDSFNEALLVANLASENSKILGNFDATHYHANYVHPNWGLRKVAKIGRHIFYS
jgi:spore germination cell wall hydrolase CwlJ-like protein